MAAVLQMEPLECVLICMFHYRDQYTSELFPSSFSRENNYWNSESQYMYLAELRRASVRSLTQLWQVFHISIYFTCYL